MLKARGKITRHGIQANVQIRPAIPVFRKDGFISQTCLAHDPPEIEPIIVGVTMRKGDGGTIQQHCIDEDFNEPKN